MKPSLFLALLLVTYALGRAYADNTNAISPLTWESANEQKMFVLSYSNGGGEGGGSGANAAIVTDTTDPKQMQIALRLQELIYRIGSVRLPVSDGKYYGDRMQCIRIVVEVWPSGEQPLYSICMRAGNPNVANPPKLIDIQAQPKFIEEALSEFTKAAFGADIKELDNPKYRWGKRNVVAIPHDFKLIVKRWR